MQYKDFINNYWASFKTLEKDFKKKNNTFIKDEGEYYTIVELQKSDFSNIIYINCGVLIKDLVRNSNKISMQNTHFNIRIGVENVYEVNLEETSVEIIDKYTYNTHKYINKNFASLDILKKHIMSNARLLNITRLKLKTYLGIN